VRVCVANDVGQGCYGAMKVRDAFANAYRELRDAVLPQYEHIQSRCSSFLGRILLVPVEVVKYRQLVEKRWQLQPSSSPSSLSSSSSAAAAEDTLDLPTAQPADDRHVLLSSVKPLIHLIYQQLSRLTTGTSCCLVLSP